MDPVEVTRLAERAGRERRFGIDTEFMPEGRYRPLLCLVQVCVGGEIALLDPLAGFDPAPLAAVLADPEVEVVLHAGRQDVAILRREWGCDIANVFDTQVAAGFAGFSAQAGYTGLLHDVLKIRLAKTASFTRWDARPLTQEQLSYAREDVEHLLPLADELQKRLRSSGRPRVGARGVPGDRRGDRRARSRGGVAAAAARHRPRPARARGRTRARRLARAHRDGREPPGGLGPARPRARRAGQAPAGRAARAGPDPRRQPRPRPAPVRRPAGGDRARPRARPRSGSRTPSGC